MDKEFKNEKLTYLYIEDEPVESFTEPIELSDVKGEELLTEETIEDLYNGVQEDFEELVERLNKTFNEIFDELVSLNNSGEVKNYLLHTNRLIIPHGFGFDSFEDLVWDDYGFSLQTAVDNISIYCKNNGIKITIVEDECFTTDKEELENFKKLMLSIGKELTK